MRAKALAAYELDEKKLRGIDKNQYTLLDAYMDKLIAVLKQRVAARLYSC